MSSYHYSDVVIAEATEKCLSYTPPPLSLSLSHIASVYLRYVIRQMTVYKQRLQHPISVLVPIIGGL